MLREAGIALVEPLAVAWHAIEQSAAKAGDNILIMGAGPIGMAILQCLKSRKPAQLIVAEVASNRRELARQFGATAVINPQEEDVISKCKLLCNGQGPEIAFDCAGVAASIKSACLSIRSKGTVVNVAKWDTEILFDMNDLLFGEKRLLSGKFIARNASERI
jgi:threonine dehydrogenase-like Zn-dependent dehydrogenase